MTFFARLLSTGFGVGYSPFAPGTCGALAMAIVYWFCPAFSISTFVFICVSLTVVGIFSASITEQEMQEKAQDKQLNDPGIIVIDEMAGMLVAFIAIPKELIFIIAAFILFRFFDIVKPFPINIVENLSSGWGIVLDDFVAGIFANIVLQIIILIL